MSFAWPHLLWLLVVPAGWLAWELTHRRRLTGAAHPKILRAEAGAHSLTLAASALSPLGRQRVRPWLCAGLACSIVALARPQWGRVEEPVFDQSREILLAIDLSRSMLTPDVKPSRLDRAKLLIQSLLEKLAGERVGLVVFSGTAFLQSPLSSDYEILREFLPSLDPDFLPQGGSDYGAMLQAAIQAFGTSGTADRFLVVLSDGEATDAEWKPQADILKKKGIRVIGLGIGTAAGGMIPDGSGGFVKDERGAVVLSKLESGTLQDLAQATDGVYRDSSTWVDLATLLKDTIEAGHKGEFVEKNTVRLVERFQWPLAFALWCLLVSLFYEFPVRPRPRDISLRAPEPKRPAAAPVAATVGLLLLAILPALGLAPASRAAATLANPPPATPTPPAAPANAQPEVPPLTRIVTRLAAAEAVSARDWAEMARETITWGARLQSEQHPVPPGPVHDALQGVDLGARLDAKTADWPKLREELEALLKNPDEKKPEDQPQDKNQQNQNQQKQDQEKSDPSKQDQEKSEGGSPEDKQNGNQPQDSGTPPPNPGESAFGDMKQQEPPPPPQPANDTQKVGGTPEQHEPPKENLDPSLALPLQKLEQLRNQDSPARLFELMEGDRKGTPKKPGKDW